MKVLFMIEWDSPKDDAKRKKYYEFFDEYGPIWNKKHEGVKHKDLGKWADQPGHLTSLLEYESMEEFSKVWSDEEFQKLLVQYSIHSKTFRMRIMRPTVIVR